ncbi:MAG: class I SAM-dependent RNA methyltransferase [Sphingomonadales bacterium]
MPVSEAEPIVRIASRGDGVTPSGRHVPMTAPGDTILADGAVAPGPHRAEPPCRHFPECGGCQLQHLDDESYRQFVADRILSALAAQGIAEPELLPVHLSPPNSRRRAALSGERRGSRVLLGFRAEASHRVIDMRECFILCPELFVLVEPLRGLLATLMPKRRSAQVRMSLADQGVDLLIENVEAEGLAAAEALTGFAQAHGLARLSLDEGLGPQTWWEPDPVTVTLSGVPVPLPHNAFLQATRDGEAALVGAVRRAAAGAQTCADLFAGLGTFALALDGRIFAAEGGRDAVLALKAGANQAGRPVVVEHRDLFRRPLDGRELARFEAVVLDPPRAGAKEQVAQLAASPVPRIAYASCNPATFARDARTLIDGGYRIEWIQPVGQFRWSTHVELAAAFTRS